MRSATWMCVVMCVGCATPAGKGEVVERAPQAAATPFVVTRDGETLWELAQAACPGEAQRVDGKVRCERCPVGSSEEGSEGGVELREALLGELWSDGRQAALVDTLGCEPHAANYGGHMELERVAGAWQLKRYEPVARVYGCEAVWFRGEPMALCNQQYGGQGLEIDMWELLSFKGGQITARGGLDASCNEAMCPSAQDTCWRGEGAGLRDVDGDGLDELVWEGTATRSTLEAGVDPAVLEGCPDRDSVPYKREAKRVAQVMTIRDGQAVPLSPAEIKDAGLRARVEAGLELPASE